jgi:hypothetical protein
LLILQLAEEWGYLTYRTPAGTLLTDWYNELKDGLTAIDREPTLETYKSVSKRLTSFAKTEYEKHKQPKMPKKQEIDSYML